LLGLSTKGGGSEFCDRFECFDMIGAKVVVFYEIIATSPEDVGQFYRLFFIFHDLHFKCSWNLTVTEPRKAVGWPGGYTQKSFLWNYGP